MRATIFKHALAYLMLLGSDIPFAAVTDNEGNETEFRFRLVVEAPAPLRDILAGGLDISRWQGYGHMTVSLLEPLLRVAREQALEAAATEGYYNAQVDIVTEASQPALRVVRLRVRSGNPTRVESVSLVLTGSRDQAAEVRLRLTWALSPGEIFRQPAWEDAKKKAVAELARTRYLGAAIAESRATVDPGRNTAQLALTLDRGPAFAFGPVTVTGLAKYPPETVTYLAPFKAGDPYARESVEVFLRRLNATNYFASAQVVVDDDPALAHAAPVHVSVLEARSRRLEAGVGYSTDTLFRATAAWRDVNMFDAAWRQRSELRVESKVQQLSSVLELPARADGWADSLDAAATRTDNQKLVTRGVTLGVTRRSIDERSQPAFGLSYYYEQQRPDNAQPDLARALFAKYEFTRRATDDLLFPRNGRVAAVRVGVSAPGLSTETFGRVVGQFSTFHSLTRRDDIAVRAELGAVLARSARGIPQALLFRTGGDTTVRGYAFESLGVARGSAIVGGRYYALASGEYTRWLAENWGLAAFIDSGNAADHLSGFRFATGYGFGARVKSPIGPFRLDVAQGRDTREIRIHVSVGLAF
jgi:translocation and assembly module TamA